MIYHMAAPKITDCYFCGEIKQCETRVADHPEEETGYIDEWAICEACKLAEGY